MKRAVILIVLIGIFYVLARALNNEAILPSPLVGQPAPDFSVPAFRADSTLVLGRLQGRPVVLNFWASWCLSCREEAAVLEAGWRKYGQDIAFVGVAVNDEVGAARAFIDRYGKTYYLGSDADGSAAIDYGLYGVPETFFIAPDGRVVSRHIGPLTAAELDMQIARLRAGETHATTGDPSEVTPLEAGAR